MAPSSPANPHKKRKKFNAPGEEGAECSMAANGARRLSAAVTEMDVDSVERPEDICDLSGDESWCADDCVATEDTASANGSQLECVSPEREIVWNKADYFPRLSSNAPVPSCMAPVMHTNPRKDAGSMSPSNFDLLQLLEDDAAPASAVPDDAAGFWVPRS